MLCADLAGQYATASRDQGKVESAGTGSILYMKGLKYPFGANGLVHKSPAMSYRQDGSVLNRLVLKVDVESVRGQGVSLFEWGTVASDL